MFSDLKEVQTSETVFKIGCLYISKLLTMLESKTAPACTYWGESHKSRLLRQTINTNKPAKTAVSSISSIIHAQFPVMLFVQVSLLADNIWWGQVSPIMHRGIVPWLTVDLPLFKESGGSLYGLHPVLLLFLTFNTLPQPWAH